MQIESAYNASYLMAITTFSPSVTIYEIFAIAVKCQTFDVEMNVKLKEEESEIGNIELYLRSF